MPALALTEGGGRRHWLPRELTYELLQFVSGTVWSARRLLTTSGVLFRLIIYGKNAKIWRQPYDVRQQEASAYENILIANKRPILPRLHGTILPFTIDTIQNFALGDDNVYKFYVLAILDQTRFPAMSIFQLYQRFCETENQGAEEMISFYEPMISYVATYEPGSQFVVFTLTYSRDVPMNLLCNSMQKFLADEKHTLDVGFVWS